MEETRSMEELVGRTTADQIDEPVRDLVWRISVSAVGLARFVWGTKREGGGGAWLCGWR